MAKNVIPGDASIPTDRVPTEGNFPHSRAILDWAAVHAPALHAMWWRQAGKSPSLKVAAAMRGELEWTKELHQEACITVPGYLERAEAAQQKRDESMLQEYEQKVDELHLRNQIAFHGGDETAARRTVEKEREALAAQQKQQAESEKHAAEFNQRLQQQIQANREAVNAAGGRI